MSDDIPGSPQVPQVRTPEKWNTGAYANGVGVWFTQTDFTLDFVVNLPPEVSQGADGGQLVVSPQEVVARVKVPPPLVFQLMRNLSTNLDRYEQQYGAIQEFAGPTLGTEEAPPVPPVEGEE
ncbi:MAG: DUF3467 domain-containing protein [Actinomycetota bacterium]|nr:DUF3467 domain-containing protein [Actinomycetota bacterium]MDQ6948699.1 DUF3467 domain-containing protein [Actinomycetota bacterium]